MPRPIVPAVAAAMLLIIAVVQVASAHSALVTASPAADSAVSGSPPELVTTWTQDLVPARTSLEVRDASGATMAKGGALGDGPRTFRLALPELAPGTYEVRWTSFSAEDGELARGTFEFAVVATATAAPTTTPLPTQATPTPSAALVGPPSDDGASVIVPIIASAAIVAALALWLRRRR